MPSNGASARADSGSGCWGGAEEGTSRSSAAAPRKGWVRLADERGPASGGTVEEGEESAGASAGKKKPSQANPTMGAARDFHSSSRVGGGERGKGPSSASVGFTKAVGETILPAACAARGMGGEKSRTLHISGENVAIDEMMLNSSSSSSFTFARQNKPLGIGLNAGLNFSDYTTEKGGAAMVVVVWQWEVN